MKIKFYLFVSFITACVYSTNAQVPVLIRVVSGEQHDTLGCNIVTDITSLVYGLVMSGNAKLWDSPSKDVQISAATLKDIEHSTGTSFLSQEIIYIYEYWSGTGKNLHSATNGLSFSNKTKNGEDVNYGYVQFSDIQDVVFSLPVNSNANGNLNSTLSFYLQSKNYYYHIIQYEGSVIDNLAESERIKMEVTGNSGRFPGSAALKDVPQKMVIWQLDAENNSDGVKYLNAKNFTNALESYFRENREMFYNMGGERAIAFVNGKSELSITKVEVKEVWKKINNSIQYDPVSVVISVNDTALNEVLYRDMVKVELLIDGLSWIDFIKSKNFPFIIQKVNNQSIKRTASYLYLKALMNHEWNRITEFVRYY